MEEDKEITRLNKYLAHSGEWTRKQAVEIIRKGDVMVNGVAELNPFYEINVADVVTLKGKVIAPITKSEYLLINKAKNNQILSNKDALQPAVEDLIKKTSKLPLKPLLQCPESMSGLMLWTNDESLIEKLQKSNRLKSVFTCTFDQAIDEKTLQKWLKKAKTASLHITGIAYIESENQHVLGVEMIGGQALDLLSFFTKLKQIPYRIDCTFIAGLTKKDLKRGWSRLLTDKEIIFLKHFS